MKTSPIVVVLLVWALLCGLSGCAENPVTGKRELSLISRDQEIAMGKQAAPEFVAEFGGPVANPQLQNYVNQIGLRVAAVSDRKDMPYHYTALNSDVPNAFALPGGEIFITAGLMRTLNNERELAAVLGHETGHVAARHNVKSLQNQIGAEVLTQIAANVVDPRYAQAAGTATQVATGMINLKYSRTDEIQADQLGVKYMSQAGYNPIGMVELLTALKNLDDQEPSRFANMFQTHPLTSDRIEKAQEMLQKQFPNASPSQPDPNAGQFQQMKQFLPPSGAHPYKPQAQTSGGQSQLRGGSRRTR